MIKTKNNHIDFLGIYVQLVYLKMKLFDGMNPVKVSFGVLLCCLTLHSTAAKKRQGNILELIGYANFSSEY